MQKLYDMAVLHHPRPTEDEQKRGVKPKSAVIVQPTTIVATDDKEASILAARAIPQEYLQRLEEVEVLVRPF